jgi:hypothetical protein
LLRPHRSLTRMTCKDTQHDHPEFSREYEHPLAPKKNGSSGVLLGSFVFVGWLGSSAAPDA